MLRTVTLGVSALSIVLLSSAAIAGDDVYANFPVTTKGYSGSKTNSVSYSGQAARHTIEQSLKKLAGKGNGKPNPELKALMMEYYAGKDPERAILSPTTKGGFKIKQSKVAEVSKGKNLKGNTFKATVTGMPNNMSGPELIEFWIDKASIANKGVDAANGYNYPQLISKFIFGAVYFNQAADKYLDEYMTAEKKPNDKPYKKGAPYTGKEHSWDEAFGYFGTPAHTLQLTPKEVHSIYKRSEDAFAKADANSDGVVDLKTEMAFAPAYYAAGADNSGKTEYLHTITKAFLDGRKIIRDAKGEKLTDAQRADLMAKVKIINTNWQATLAEAVYNYAGSVYKDMGKLQTIIEAKGDPAKVNKAYIKHWGELKGFSLALQAGKENLGETATRLNRMIGYGPVLINQSQVVDIDSKGNYVRDQGLAWGEYMLHMAKVQKLMVDQFGVKAKKNEISGDIATLANQLGAGTTAEND